MPENRIERLCVEKGMKMTEQRRIIARVLSSADDHPDVEEVYKRAIQLDPKISIATIYRIITGTGSYEMITGTASYEFISRPSE